MPSPSRRLRGVPLAIVLIAAACGGTEAAGSSGTAETVETVDTAGADQPATNEAPPSPAEEVADPTAPAEADSSSAPSPAEATDGEIPTAAVPTASPEPDPEPTVDATAASVVEVVYADGDVTVVDDRISVDRGDTVTVRITSDVAEHAHLHGYDVYVDIDAGGTAMLQFVADVPGVFELEFEDSHAFITEFQVS